MSVIIRLQNLPQSASSIDIRYFFLGVSIPDGGVNIVGGQEGDAFIAFSTDEDARQAMRLAAAKGQRMKESRVSLFPSSRNEMYKVIEQARIAALSGSGGGGLPSKQQNSISSSNPTHHHNQSTHLGSEPSMSSLSPQQSHHHASSGSSNLRGHGGRHQSDGINSVSSSMSPSSTSSAAANDYLRSITGGSIGGGMGGLPDLTTNPTLLFSSLSGMNPTLGASPSAFLDRQHHHNQGYPGMGSMSSQQQGQGFGGANGGHPTTTATAPPTSVFPNGNPFLVPPPNMSGISMPFPGIPHGAGGDTSSQAPGAGNNFSGGGGGGPANALGIRTTSAAMSLTPNFMSITMPNMSMAGHGQQHPMNPFGNGPPPRMGLMNSGKMGGQGHAGHTGHNASPQAAVSSGDVGGPRHFNNFGMSGMAGMNNHANAFGGAGANADISNTRGKDRDSRHSQNSSGSGSGHHHRSSRFSNAPHQSICIAIRGLAPTVTKQELVGRYLRDTPCQDVVLIAAPTPTNRHSVTAFVQFESTQVAQAVIAGIVTSPLGTQLVVESCELDDLQRARDRTSGSSVGKVGLSRGSPGIGGGPDAKSIFELDIGMDDETTTVIMKGAAATGIPRFPNPTSSPNIFDQTLQQQVITLYHYTTRAGYLGITKTGKMKASSEGTHAKYGVGVYFCDLPPSSGLRKIVTNNWGRFTYKKARKVAYVIELESKHLTEYRTENRPHGDPHYVYPCERGGDLDLSLIPSYRAYPTNLCYKANSHRCLICQKKFKRSFNLKDHTRIHTKQKPFTCRFCHKAFTNNSTLTTHLRTHTGQKPFKCEWCPKAFTVRCSLNNHLRTHTGQKPFKCPSCPKAFTWRGTLKNHLRTHTGQKPFQ